VEGNSDRLKQAFVRDLNGNPVKIVTEDGKQGLAIDPFHPDYQEYLKTAVGDQKYEAIYLQNNYPKVESQSQVASKEK